MLSNIGTALRHACRRALVVAGVVICVPATEAAANLYAEDLAAAKRSVARVGQRVSTAASDAAIAARKLPVARAEAQRLRDVTAVRQRRAAVAATRSAARENDVRQTRRAAQQLVAATTRRTQARIAGWRSDRATWLSLAAILLGGACAVGLFVAAVKVPRPDEERDRDAVRLAIGLGVTIAAGLAGLLVVLSWADAWKFSWRPLLAGIAIILLPALAIAAGWRAEHRPPRRRLFTTFAGPAVLLAVGAAVPIGFAAAADRPQTESLPSEVLLSARAADTGAAMPSSVQRLRRQADDLSGLANTTSARGARADALVEELVKRRDEATQRQQRARRALDRARDHLDSVREDFDRYAELIDPADEDLDRQLPELDRRYEPPTLGAPTTEDFGQGSGSVGTCADGTLSDSIGRPGACSHHGGVG